MSRTTLGLGLALVCLALGSVASHTLAQAPRTRYAKPATFPFDARFHHPRQLRVQFCDGTTVRAADGRLSDLGTAALETATPVLEVLDAAGATWRRSFTATRERLAELQANAVGRLGREVADPNLAFDLLLPEGADTGAMIDALHGLDCVEYALPAPTTLQGAGTPPDFTANQTYTAAGPAGAGTSAIAAMPGGRGAGTKILVVDVGVNATHVDVPPVTLLGGAYDPFNPAFDPDHGTADLALIGAPDDGAGVTGIASDALFFTGAASTPTALFNIANAINVALAMGFGPGDVIWLPLSVGTPIAAGVPIEFDLPTYNAIVLAIGNGVVVTASAGNAGQDLDDPQLNLFGFNPLLPQNESGSIIVGAGGVAAGSGSRVRVSFSNYGSAVDVQAQGELVFSAGYGLFYNALGPDAFYVATYQGTSPAAGIVAGIVAQLQGILLANGLPPQSPAFLRTLLRLTGHPQLGTGTSAPALTPIGPSPDAALAAAALLANRPLIESITPTFVSAGTIAPTLLATGLNFDPLSLVTLNGVPYPTMLVAPNQLEVQLPNLLFVNPTQFQVRVDNLVLGTGTSNAIPLPITAPTLSTAGAGASFVRVDGSTGGSARRVDVALGTPFTLSVDQPPVSPSPTNYVLFATLGVPPATDSFTIAGVAGTTAVAPCIADPGNPHLFTLASTIPYVAPCTPLFTPGLTPAAATIPGIPFAVRFTIQGVIQILPTVLVMTNGLIVDIH